MPQHRTKVTEEVVQRWYSSGRGQGERDNYQPWITVRDVPSMGQAQAIPGLTLHREHHLLSKGEAKYFMLVEYSGATDIQEQYPLPREETQEVVAGMGIRHPVYPNTAVPRVITTDFVITYGDRRFARAVKTAESLSNVRALRSLEIERRYWARQRVDWRLIISDEISNAVYKHLDCLRSWAREGSGQASENQIDAFFRVGPTVDWAVPLGQALTSIAKAMRISRESTIGLFGYLAWHRLITVDIRSPLSLVEPHPAISDSWRESR